MSDPTSLGSADTHPRVIAYTVGICSASVCVEEGIAGEAIEEELNRAAPTGISSQWRIADESFADGSPNPCPCNLQPGRSHYLLHC